MGENRSMVEDAMIMMSGDMFKRIYDLGDKGWPFVVETIKDWAMSLSVSWIGRVMVRSVIGYSNLRRSRIGSSTNLQTGY